MAFQRILPLLQEEDDFFWVVRSVYVPPPPSAVPICRNCCPVSCLIYGDNFSRDYDPDYGVGSNFEEISGDWTIDNYQLQTMDSNALIIYKKDHPDGIPSQKVSSFIKAMTIGDQIRHIVGYDYEQSYLFSEVEFTNGREGNLRLYQRSGGVNTQLGENVIVHGLALNTNYRLETCYSPSGYLQASILDEVLGEEGYGPEGYTCHGKQRSLSKIWLVNGPGYRIGLGTGNITSYAFFDNLRYARHSSHYDFTNDSPCHTCDNDCIVWQDLFHRNTANYSGVPFPHGMWQSNDPWYQHNYGGHEVNCNSTSNGFIGISGVETSTSLIDHSIIISSNAIQSESNNHILESTVVTKWDSTNYSMPYGHISTVSGIYIVDYLNDNYYHFVSYYGFNTTLNIEAFKKEGGILTSLGSPDLDIISYQPDINILGDPVKPYMTSTYISSDYKADLLRVCMLNDRMILVTNDTTNSYPSRIAYMFETTPNDGRKVGLGISGVNKVPVNNEYFGFTRATLEEYSDNIIEDKLIDCDNCEVCFPCDSDNVPFNVRLTIASVYNEDCNECTNYNGSYILSFKAGYSLNTAYRTRCRWEYDTVTDQCFGYDSDNILSLELNDLDDTYYGPVISGVLTASLFASVGGFGSSPVSWSTRVPYPLDCAGLSGLLLHTNVVDDGDYCDWSNSTVTCVVV